MSKFKNQFYLVGIAVIIYGILGYFEFDLPMRNGKMPENPLDYANNNILFGVAIIIFTYLIDRYYPKRK